MINNLAPIILFVYNRPEHTTTTIKSLKRNPLAEESELFVFSDGPKNKDDELAVKYVRDIVDVIDGFKSVTVTKRSVNYGLAYSVINGVTDVIERYGRAIVLEDDLHLSPFFLDFMNKALVKFENEKKIFSLGGYTPKLEIPTKYDMDFFLSYRCCTWGWATWRDRWKKVDWDNKDFDQFIKDKDAVARFNRGGDDMSHIFQLQMQGKISSWGIRWDYAHFRNNGYCFRPIYSLVGNTGNDGTGVHCRPTNKFDVSINSDSNFNLPNSEKIYVDEEINDSFATFYDGRNRKGIRSVSSVINMYNGILRRWLGRLLK